MKREPLDAGRFFAPEQRSVATMLQAQAQKFGAKMLVQSGDQSRSEERRVGKEC